MLWSEPTKLIALRWGRYKFRYLASLLLIIGGAIIAQPTSVYSGYLLEIGISAQVIGWLVNPTEGPRRAVIVVPSAVCASALLIGTAGGYALVVPLVAWLLLRKRPARSYLVIVLPIVTAAILSAVYPNYGDGIVVAVIYGAVLIGSAWLARTIAASPRSQNAG